MTDHQPRKVAGYELAAPSEQDLIFALGRMLGSDQVQATWTDVCAECGAHRPDSPMSLDQLLAVAELLAERPGLKVPARSFIIRLNSYRMLSNREG